MRLRELPSAVIRGGTFQPTKVGHYRRRLQVSQPETGGRVWDGRKRRKGAILCMCIPLCWRHPYDSKSSAARRVLTVEGRRAGHGTGSLLRSVQLFTHFPPVGHQMLRICSYLA